MPVIETLHKIRGEESKGVITLRQKILQVLLLFILGMLLGFIAKYSDTIPANSLQGNFWSVISYITTRLGIWILFATVIAAWSNNPRIGAIKVFAFFSGMLLLYYFYSMRLFNFFPTYYFIRWGGIALISPIAAYIVWFSRGNGWSAAFCSSMPIGLLVYEGYPFFYLLEVTLGFNILAAILLLLSLSSDNKQRLRISTLTLLVVLILRNSNVLSYIFGGL